MEYPAHSHSVAKVADAEVRAWNPRYVAYAEAQGFDPDTMLAVDRLLWPGGRMVGFMLWIGERWHEWRQAHERSIHDVLSSEDFASFDASLGL